MRRVLIGVLFSSAFTLLLLEGTIRLVHPQVLPRDAPDLWHPDDTIGWRHNPNVSLSVNTGERDVDVCTDAIGDRIRCGQAAIRTCEKTVLVVGDSFVEALAVPYEQTVWTRLEADIGACLRVAGVGAYGLSQYVAVIRERLADERIDLVLLNFYAGNDFTEDPERIPPPTEVQRRPIRLLPAGLSLNDLRDWFYPFNSWLESRSHAYVAGRFAIRRLRDPGDVGIYGVPIVFRPSRMTEAIYAGSARGVQLAAEAARAGGARFIATVIPHRSQVLDPTGEELIAGLPKLEGDVDMDLLANQFVPLLRAIPHVDEIVDLLPYLREHADRRAWGTRDGHFSPDGHRLWFEAVREPVRRSLGLDRAS